LASVEIRVSNFGSENAPKLESGVDEVVAAVARGESGGGLGDFVAAVARGESGGGLGDLAPKMDEFPPESDHEADFEIDSLSYYSSENNLNSKFSPVPPLLEQISPLLQQISPDGINVSAFDEGPPKISYHLCRTSTGVVEIPVNEENPRQCAICLKIFQNHFRSV
jgi:hypothetical protein